jgi:glycine/D-amino acid oxidase-like deaminating enzyme
VQFSRPENIEMSKYGIDFIRNFDARTGHGQTERARRVGRRRYLFIVPPEAVPNLERNVRRQRGHGLPRDLLSPAELKARFPSMRVDDLGAARTRRTTGGAIPTACCGDSAQGDRDGRALRAGSRRGGGMRPRESEVRAPASGDSLKADAFVNAPGAWRLAKSPSSSA